MDHSHFVLTSIVAFTIWPVDVEDHVVVTAKVFEYDDPYTATRSLYESSLTEALSFSRRKFAPALFHVAADASMLAAQSDGIVAPIGKQVPAIKLIE